MLIRWTTHQGTRYQLPDQTIPKKVVKSVLKAEHAIVLDRIRKETAKDNQLQKLYKRIVKED